MIQKTKRIKEIKEIKEIKGNQGELLPNRPSFKVV